MPRLSRALLLAALLVPTACTDRDPSHSPLAPAEPAAAPSDAPGLKVMTQNMYLGVNLDLLLTAAGPAEIAQVFAQLQATTIAGDFGRAQQMALQIALEAPHLVGLQEVTTYVFDFGGRTVQALPFVTVLQGYLDYLQVVPGLTLWPSDHAGVVATLWPAPGLGTRQ